MATAQHATKSPAEITPIDSPGGAWREFAQRMVQSALHSVCLSPGDSIALHNNLLQALKALKGNPEEDAVREHGRKIAAALERHNQVTQRAVMATMSELRGTMETLSLGLSAMAGDREIGTHIETVQNVLSAAATPEELEIARERVSELVGTIAMKERERIHRQDEFIRELQLRIDRLEKARAQPGPKANKEPDLVPTVDALTGVPNGVAARTAILRAQSDERPPHIAVIHIQSLDVLNARFGQRIGDQIVLTCCQHLASNLCRENDRIFRWRGPAFVVLLDRDDSPAGVSREVSHVCNSIASSFFGEPHRSILIPVKMASTSIPLEGRMVTDVFDAIDYFIVRAGRSSV